MSRPLAIILAALVAATALLGSVTTASAADTGAIAGTIRHQPGETRDGLSYPAGSVGLGLVEVYRDRKLVDEVRADGSGRYRVGGLAPGTYEVVLANVEGNFYIDFFPELYREKVLFAARGTPVTVQAGKTATVNGNLAPLFADMFDTPFTDNIAFLRNTGITKGCNPNQGNTRYCPDEPVTRGQMAAFLNRAFSLPEAPSDSGFTDTGGSVFEEDIERLAADGITKGCNPDEGNTRFCPDEFVTRGQMAAFIVRGFGLPRTADPLDFDDVSSDNTFAEQIRRLAAAEVTRGCNPDQGNTRYCPDENVTRGQMAAFIERAFDYVLRSFPSAGGPVVNEGMLGDETLAPSGSR